MFITSIFKDLELLFDYIVVTIVLNKTLISLRFSKAWHYISSLGGRRPYCAAIHDRYFLQEIVKLHFDRELQIMTLRDQVPTGCPKKGLIYSSLELRFCC